MFPLAAAPGDDHRLDDRVDQLLGVSARPAGLWRQPAGAPHLGASPAEGEAAFTVDGTVMVP